MAFGCNQVNLIGRLGVRVDISTLPNARRVVNFSVATDESYIRNGTDEVVDKSEWHRIVSFQEGIVKTLERHGARGRLVHVCGKLQTREWADTRGVRRFTTEILITPQGRVQFLDKPRNRAAPDAAPTPADDDRAPA